MDPKGIGALEHQMTNFTFKLALFDVFVHMPFEIAFSYATFPTKFTGMKSDLFVDSRVMNFETVPVDELLFAVAAWIFELQFVRQMNFFVIL